MIFYPISLTKRPNIGHRGVTEASQRRHGGVTESSQRRHGARGL